MTASPPLLVLAGGGRPRLRRAPIVAPPESNLQIDTADLLRAHCLPDWKWTHIPSGGLRDVITASRMKRFGLQKGWPDILMISPQPLPHFLELKRAGGVLTGDQDELRQWCIRVGVPHAVAWAFDQVLAAFGQWGCLRVKIAPRAQCE